MPGKQASDPKDWKTKRIYIRVSYADYQAIKEIAAARGLSVSDLVRMSILPGNSEPEHDKG